jgi:peptide-methionine (S)-S-oxide reductase
MNRMRNGREFATLGGGCFWCTEAVFSELRGVEKVESGYSGGTVPNPSYRQVCEGTTGHAEVAQITFDPNTISFETILKVFFTVHDPTTRNRQGADVGSQYKSIILYHTREQKETAEKVMQEISRVGIWSKPIVTELVPFKAFYKAEDYHQQYYKNNSVQPYCQIVIAPKVSKLREHYRELLKRRR